MKSYFVHSIWNRASKEIFWRQKKNILYNLEKEKKIHFKTRVSHTFHLLTNSMHIEYTEGTI